MKFGSAEAENSLSLDRATDDCQPVPSLSPPLRVNEWATKILPSSVLRISSATYLTVKSLYLSERIPQRYKFTLPRNEHLFDSFSRGGGLRPSFIRILRGLETGVVPEGKNRPPVFSERVVAREYRPGSVRPGEGGKRRKGNGESDSDDDWVEMRSSRPRQSGDACAQLPPRFSGEG